MEEVRSLVVRAQAGDLDAYGEIVRRFQDMAYGYASAILSDFHLAEDAAQEAFIQAYRDLRKLDNPAAFPGWFRRIVFKECDRLVRGKQVRTVPLESARGVASDRPGPDKRAERLEMADRVLSAIRSLPENERTVTTLFYIDGYSQKDIAEFLEVPVTTVNNRLHASRNRLKERMIAMVAEELQSSKPGADFQTLVRRAIGLQEERKFEEAVSAHEAALQAAEGEDVGPEPRLDSYIRLCDSYEATDRWGILARGMTLAVASGSWAGADRILAFAQKLKGRPAYRFWLGEAHRAHYLAALAEGNERQADKHLREVYANLDAYEEELAAACPGLNTKTDTDEDEQREWFTQVGHAYHNAGSHFGSADLLGGVGKEDRAEALRLLRRALELRDVPVTRWCLAGLVLLVEGDRKAALAHLRASQLGPEDIRKMLQKHPAYESVRDDPEFLALARD